MLKLATWNVNSIRVRLDQVLDWLRAESPDILAIQETKVTNDMFPVNEFLRQGYQVICNGQKTYNGVATISKSIAAEVVTELPSFPDPQKRLLYTRYDNLAILNIYVPNGMALGTEKFDYKLDWLSHLQVFVQQQINKTKRLVVLGDFNIAPADEDVHNPEEWRGKVLVSEQEREQFFLLIDKGLVDCYRIFKQEAKSFSWWDYRVSSFIRNRGLRIDHILASKPLAECCISSHIDKTPRKLERPSDHTPVVAEFNL